MRNWSGFFPSSEQAEIKTQLDNNVSDIMQKKQRHTFIA
jgi:hypothetical protein